MAFRYKKEAILENWRQWFRTKRDDADYQRLLFDELTQQLSKNGTTAEFDQAEEMKDEYVETLRRVSLYAQSECPIAFFKPSWEQAQLLNSWSPQFDPDNAPEGYRTACNFNTNRGGKSTADVIDTLAWLIPNDPDWVMFETHPDVEGIKAGKDRGPYTVFPRPDWEAWRRTGRMTYPWLSAPPKAACEVWHGVENAAHWEDKIGREYQKWLPKSAIAIRSDGGIGIFKQERRLELKGGSSITGKTYNADSQDWAGKAVWRINMDEGFEKRIFDEATMRVQAGGYFHWAYTAAEARNTGQRAKLAHECYKGKHKLVGKTKFFTGFRMDMIPDWIMPADKKADDLARLRNEGEMGRVRMGEIPFFESSPLVFTNFDRERNILPIEGSDALLAIHGKSVDRWVREFGKERSERLQGLFYRANIVRGLDEGMAAPTAAGWVAILPTGEYVAFKNWEKANLSVSQRCEAVIELSGNRRYELRWDEDETRRIYREETVGMKIRKTLADSKMFKRNQEIPSDDWTGVYARAGLKLERAGNIGPAARCDMLNDMMRGDPTRKHLLNASEVGAKFYTTRNCEKLVERFENYLFEQIATGQRAGEFTGDPEKRDDHTIDVFCYVAISKLRWVDFDATADTQVQSIRRDPLTGYVRR